jgi:hypothetical protein
MRLAGPQHSVLVSSSALLSDRPTVCPRTLFVPPQECLLASFSRG